MPAAPCKIEAPYPAAEAGQKRVIFTLDPAESRRAEAAGHRLQLVPGRTVTVPKSEAVNIRSYGGEVEEHALDGWGISYYSVQLSEHALTTMMMYTGDDADQQVRKFVPISQPKLVRYNSANPVVVYLPEDAELRYSVWSAGDEMVAAQE